jgi:hypothetical protein
MRYVLNTSQINYNIIITSANIILFLYQETELYSKYLYITLIVIKLLLKKDLTRVLNDVLYKRVDCYYIYIHINSYRV